MHRHTLCRIERTKLGLDEHHRKSDFLIPVIGIGLEFTHLNVRIAHRSAVVLFFDVTDDPRVEGVEPAAVKYAVLFEKLHRQVNRFLGVFLDLNTEPDVRTLLCRQLQGLLQRRYGNALSPEGIAELFGIAGIQLLCLCKRHVAQMTVYAAGAPRIAVVHQNGNFIGGQPHVKLKRIDTEVHCRGKGNECVFGVFRAVAAMTFHNDIFHNRILPSIIYIYGLRSVVGVSERSLSPFQRLCTASVNSRCAAAYARTNTR